jgi:nitrite reductase/ring-hydroxylating ferredoxin subunit
MRKLLALAAITLCFASCGKMEGLVPSVSVNFTIPKTDPRVAALNSAGGAVTINGYGVAGLILYRAPNGAYLAYDRCSSYQPEKLCAVNVDDTGFTVTDPCSGSKFSLSDGTPVKAPATKALKSYHVNVTQFQINVYN